MAERPASEKKQFVDGEEFLFLGKKYTLKITGDIRPGVELRDNLCVSGKTGPEIQKLSDRLVQDASR